jgi:ubiquinone/menaquinone biosynthesis C-methylase UbiE
MRPWYVESFGREYLALYSHRNEAEARADIRAVMDLVALAKDEPLLDLGCGAGRHLLALYEAGFSHLVGLDLSQELLDVAAKRLAAAGVEGIELVQADMREIPYVGHFATVLSLFTSFGYFEDDETDQAVLAAVNRALQPGGIFLIDTLNRDWVIAHLVPKEERTLSGRVLLIERRVSEDRRRVEKATRVIEEGGEERTFYESVRMYTGDELEEMLKDVRFANVQRYGSLRGEPHCSASKRLILVAEKEG